MRYESTPHVRRGGVRESGLRGDLRRRLGSLRDMPVSLEDLDDETFGPFAQYSISGDRRGTEDCLARRLRDGWREA
jgi:hypothetical protein